MVAVDVELYAGVFLAADHHVEYRPAVHLRQIGGGAVGGTLGMYQFHHKTKHRSFQIGFPFLAVLQLLLLGDLWMN